MLNTWAFICHLSLAVISETNLFPLLIFYPFSLSQNLTSSSVLLTPLEQEFNLPLISVSVSDGSCPRMEALVPKHTLSVSYHGGRLF